MDMWRPRSRRGREQRQLRALAVLAALVLFAGLFGQVALRAQISGQVKRVDAVRREIQALSANAENLSLCINQYHNLADISVRAQNLGMAMPTDDQLRVVSLPAVEDTPAPVAEGAGEEIG